MDDDRILKQVISWEMSATSRGPGRPRKNWNAKICRASEWPVRTQNTSPSIEKDGMNVWPNVS